MNIECKRFLGVLSAVVLGAIMVPTAKADVIGFAGPWAADGNGTYAVGNDFNVTDPAGITITKLGVFDAGSNGLATSHEVDLFAVTGGTLLASVTVPSGTTFDASEVVTGAGVMRFMNLATPVFLATGTQFSVDSFFVSNGDGWGFSNPAGNAAAGEVAVVDGRWGMNTSGYPTSTGGVFTATSFELVSGNQTAPVPEPASLGMLGLGGLALLIRRRKRA
jgi:hypothetical protein